MCRRAHGVGKSWPPIVDLVAARRRPSINARRPRSERRLRRNRADVPLHEQGSELLDRGDAGLGLGGDALDALHLEA
jgi:hypothetical protein